MNSKYIPGDVVVYHNHTQGSRSVYIATSTMIVRIIEGEVPVYGTISSHGQHTVSTNFSGSSIAWTQKKLDQVH